MRSLVLILALAAALVACDDDDDKKRSSNDDTTTTVSDGLNFKSTTGSGVTENPPNTFSIPTCGKGKLGYIVTKWKTPMAGSISVTFSVAASPDAIIVGYEDHKSSGRAALFIQRRNDTDTASKDPYALDERLYNRGYREWSHARKPLAVGDHTFSVPLVPTSWNFPDQLSKALEDPAYVGITLSGAESAGHGVCMLSGTASVTLKTLTVS
jgi:hypothetical protein